MREVECHSNLSEMDLNANCISQLPECFWFSVDIETATKYTHSDQNMACYAIHHYILQTSIRSHRTIKVKPFPYA